jgi:hypothetical protein
VLAAADVGNQLAQDKQSASLLDYRSICEKEKVKFPKDVSETCITLCRFAVLCQVLFQGIGPAHPRHWAYKTSRPQSQIINKRSRVHPEWYRRILHASCEPCSSGCTKTFRGSVLAMNVAESMVGVEKPNFQSMLQDLKRGKFHLSTNWTIPIPAEYMGVVTPQTASMTSGSGGRS